MKTHAGSALNSVNNTQNDPMESLQNQNRFLTISDVACRLQMSQKMIIRLVRDEGLPACRLTARHLRFHWPSVEGWVLQRGL